MQGEFFSPIFLSFICRLLMRTVRKDFPSRDGASKIGVLLRIYPLQSIPRNEGSSFIRHSTNSRGIAFVSLYSVYNHHSVRVKLFSGGYSKHELDTHKCPRIRLLGNRTTDASPSAASIARCKKRTTGEPAVRLPNYCDRLPIFPNRSSLSVSSVSHIFRNYCF